MYPSSSQGKEIICLTCSKCKLIIMCLNLPVLEDVGVRVVLPREHVDQPALVGDARVVKERLHV